MRHHKPGRMEVVAGKSAASSEKKHSLFNRSSPRSFCTVLIQALFFIVCGTFVIKYHKWESLILSSTSAAQQAKHPPEFFIQRKVCQSALHLVNDNDSFASIQNAYKELHSFHNEGGSLTALTQYLTANIDNTFKIHGMKFTPKEVSTDKQASTRSIVAQVKEALVANDRKNRGGYDQRQLPGQIAPSDNKELLHEGRIIEVIEPWDKARWEVGLGPIFPKVCKSVDVIKAKTKGISYEDKFMCSYNSLMVNTTDKEVSSKDEDGNECDMISIGSNGQWGFEENVVASTKCVTHTFDCTISNPNKPSKESI
eukprot:15345198-Ditylum_brightwellii.AAC.1